MNNKLKIFSTIAFSLAILSSPIDLKAEDLKGMGVPEEPHGYPAWFSDSNGLKLELCIDPEPNPLLNRCANDPVIADNEWSVITGFGGEAFWLLAGAAIDEDTVPAPSNGLVEAELTLALEAAYGTDESIVDGNQVSFGRVRIRMDLDESGTYRVTHPYGQIVFADVDASDPDEDRDVNYTSDIGAANLLAPAVAFGGTMNSAIMSPVGSILPLPATTSFITSTAFANNPDAFRFNDKQYIADLVPTTIVGSPTGNNFFRVERLTGPDTWTIVGETILFDLFGRVYDGHEITEKTSYGNIPTQNLAAVGPVNRATPFLSESTAIITGTLVPGYPIGYPLWYQDRSGLKLTITFPPMGISDPIDGDDGPWPLNTAGETFYWSASANFNEVPAAGPLNPTIEFAVEGTFGGDEEVVDGNQIAFTRMRIRIDTPAAGTYTVTHPYGSNTFEVDAAALADGINYTQDIGSAVPGDPDSVFNGALYGIVGPNFLTWSTFDPNPTLNDPLLQKENPANPSGPKLQYVGDPAIPHAIKGGPNGNIVRIEGPDESGIDVQTNLFEVTGQVFFERNNNVVPAVNLLLLEE